MPAYAESTYILPGYARILQSKTPIRLSFRNILPIFYPPSAPTCFPVARPAPLGVIL
jgi:hypothetical protein